MIDYDVKVTMTCAEYERLIAERRRLIDRIDERDAEIKKLRSELDARCPVDAGQRGMTPVEAAVWHVWGERCSDYEPGCLTCRAWTEFDRIKQSASWNWIVPKSFVKDQTND